MTTKGAEREQGHTEKAPVIFVEGKYGILLSGRNWIVATLNDGMSGIERNTDDFNPKTYTYHANTRQAIINMADRMLEDELTKACASKPLELKELVDIIREKDWWMRKAITGMAEL